MRFSPTLHNPGITLGKGTLAELKNEFHGKDIDFGHSDSEGRPRILIKMDI